MNLQPFIKATPIIDCDTSVIKDKVMELTSGQNDVISKAQALFYFVRDDISYNIFVTKKFLVDFKASRTLTRGEGYCVQKAVLLAALARAAGIPSRLGFARLRNNLMPETLMKWLETNILPFHGYTELYLADGWVKVTPAFDIKLCKQNKIVPVDFDGHHDAMFHSHNEAGELHMEYLVDLGHYEDVPLDKLWNTLISEFGPKYLDPPKFV